MTEDTILNNINVFASSVYVRLGERASDITMSNQVFMFSVSVSSKKIVKKPVAKAVPKKQPTTFDDYGDFSDDDFDNAVENYLKSSMDGSNDFGDFDDGGGFTTASTSTGRGSGRGRGRGRGKGRATSGAPKKPAAQRKPAVKKEKPASRGKSTYFRGRGRGGAKKRGGWYNPRYGTSSANNRFDDDGFIDL